MDKTPRLRWSPEEVEFVRQACADGVCPAVMAGMLKRTEVSVLSLISARKIPRGIAEQSNG